MENKRLYTIYSKNWKDPISGIIESSSNYWVLIKRIPNDYILDGFAFIQKCHIESYKRTEEDRFKEKILIAKGIMDIPVPEFSISNRLDLLNRLNALQCVVEIQTDLESSFFIGKLEEVKTSIFRWKSMDNRGKWENDLRQLRVRDIVSINVNTDYVTSLVAYNQSL